MSAETVPCPTCSLPALPEFPHKHVTPVREDYDPVGRYPTETYCGHIDLSSYWAGAWNPDCCATHHIASELRAELPQQLHIAPPRRRRAGGHVPDRLEPIPLEPGNPTGPVMEVKDTGALGAPSWSVPAHARFGAVTHMFGETGVSATDLRQFPWALAIETRLPHWCQRRHVGRDPGHGERTLCVELVREVVVRGDTLSAAAKTLEVPRTVAVRVLDDALRFVWKRVSEQLNEVELGRVRRDEG